MPNIYVIVISTIIVRPHTHTHTRPTALPWPQNCRQ